MDDWEGERTCYEYGDMPMMRVHPGHGDDFYTRELHPRGCPLRDERRLSLPQYLHPGRIREGQVRALTGYEDVLLETARLTEDQVELDEDAMGGLDAQLRVIMEHLTERPEVTITFSRLDTKKAGGA